MRQVDTFNSHRTILFPDAGLVGGRKYSSILKNLRKAVDRIRGFVRHINGPIILVVAMLAFEIFNFGTTRFALADLMGEANFVTFRWATILAIALCAIDFAGLIYLFGPDRTQQSQRELWYLMGAWLAAATMNALMTWWAISVAITSVQTGFVVFTRSEVLSYAPMLVAVFAWVTRILFIIALTISCKALNRSFKDISSRDNRNIPKLTIQTRPIPRVRKLPSLEAIPQVNGEMPPFLETIREGTG